MLVRRARRAFDERDASGPSPTQRHTRFRPQCLACGYDLRGLGPGRCPECGSAARVPVSWPLAPLRWWTVRASRVGTPLIAVTLLLIAAPHVVGAVLPLCWRGACIHVATASALLIIPVGAVSVFTARSAAEDRLAWTTIAIGAFILVHFLLAHSVVLL